MRRRPRQRLLHGALKLASAGGSPHTLELMPAFARQDVAPLITGPVGLRLAGSFRLFRYQLLYLEAQHLPDEEFAVAPPARLSVDPIRIERLLEAAREVPPYTWGRRAPHTREMWTSDSVVSWLLVRSGIEASGLVPTGARAPGWDAGIEVARRQAVATRPISDRFE